MNIIIADDDAQVLKSLDSYLTDFHHKITCVTNGKDLLEHIKKNKTLDLIISDVNMPILNGIEACKKIREFSKIPIIMVSSCKSEIDRVIGLEIGADDYIVKPFSQRELLARIRAVSRRFYVEMPEDNRIYPEYHFLEWILKTSDQSLRKHDGTEIIISSGLYNLILAFVTNPNRVLSRESLMDLTKSRMLESFDRTIDVQVGRIRKKLNKDKYPNLIKTIRSEGYMFTAEVEIL
ncbi:response regulator transcription factor [Francisella sp. SYW-2]|uniref:response regulator transcription factor n=1 Tax=Francisella sp. SYW-2 TaxID=2610886 RepID=UPI00123CAFE9|nr:response regulator transcription factor [Francisella sp. SYW-2]